MLFWPVAHIDTLSAYIAVLIIIIIKIIIIIDKTPYSLTPEALFTGSAIFSVTLYVEQEQEGSQHRTLG